MATQVAKIDYGVSTRNYCPPANYWSVSQKVMAVCDIKAHGAMDPLYDRDQASRSRLRYISAFAGLVISETIDFCVGLGEYGIGMLSCGYASSWCVSSAERLCYTASALLVAPYFYALRALNPYAMISRQNTCPVAIVSMASSHGNYFPEMRTAVEKGNYFDYRKNLVRFCASLIIKDLLPAIFFAFVTTPISFLTYGKYDWVNAKAYDSLQITSRMAQVILVTAMLFTFPSLSLSPKTEVQQWNPQPISGITLSYQIPGEPRVTINN